MDFGKLLGAVGSAVTGNWGGAIQSTLEGVGILPSTPKEEVKKILEEHPEIRIALIEAETEQTRIKAENETEKLRIERENFQKEMESARSLSLEQMRTGSNWFERSQIFYFGVGSVIGMCFFLYILMTNQFVLQNYKDIVTTIFGAILGIIGTIYAFYFGAMYKEKNTQQIDLIKELEKRLK